MTLTEEEKKENLRKLPIGQIRFLLHVLDETIREAQGKGDERWEKLINQQRRLNEILVEKQKEMRKAQEIDEPEPVTVGMRALRLTAKRIRP